VELRGYRYRCSCGFEHTQMLREDKFTLVLTCLRCGRGISARRVDDKNAEVKENNGVAGIFNRD